MDRRSELISKSGEMLGELIASKSLSRYPGWEDDLCTWSALLRLTCVRDYLFLDRTLEQGKKALSSGEKLPRFFSPYLQGRTAQQSEQLFWEGGINTCVAYLRRKTIEINSLLEALNSIDNGAGSVLELCSGAGNLGALLAASGRETTTLEIKVDQVNIAHSIAIILKSHERARLRIEHGDLLSSRTVAESKAVTWIAKHPCAHGVAMPDEIIARWLVNPNAKNLVIMTCCSGKARRAFPEQLSPWLEQSMWKELCTQSERSNHQAQTVRSAAQSAMDEIDLARVKFIQSKGFRSELRHVRETVKGNIIVAQK